jgi:hypothetical protein
MNRTFSTPRNVFGLSREFYGKEIPVDDPESEITFEDLSNISVRRSPLPSPTFYPFPNRSAFVMGDWFWNSGVQKSIQSFREPMGILGDPEWRKMQAGCNRRSLFRSKNIYGQHEAIHVRCNAGSMIALLGYI